LDKGKITAVFATLLLITTIIASLLPQATATPTTITTITPNSGPVGTTVRVTGEIDTVNGSYQILWDGESVKNGTAVEKAVNDTFVVPLSAEDDHNVTLYDMDAQTESPPELFTVTTSYSVSAEPARIQEGLNTNITVDINEAEANATYTLTINVTDPQPQTYTAALNVSTNTTGSGSNSTLYYGNFSAGANTNYVGTYTIAVIAINETLTTGNFTVGLTDKLEYRRTETVHIRCAGYKANETVTINITTAGVPVADYPKNVTASSDGIVTHSWEIPIGITPGTYTVSLTNATMQGTVKPVLDIQNFGIERIFIDPTSGRWGTMVWVVGKIVTSNGTYQILWNGKSVKEGIAQSDGAVNDTFIVPPSAKGDHNITLYDVNQTTESIPSTFEVTTSCYVLAEPARIVEGLSTTITVGVREAEANVNYTFTINITDPLNRNWTANSLVMTDGDGSGGNSTEYPGDFVDADTDYLGTYSLAVNATLATGSFTVGLTDELEYRRTNEVIIRGSGYDAEEIVTVNITIAGVSVEGYPKNLTAAPDGVVTYFWTIPENATLGIYSLTLANATTPGTVKLVRDIQNFTVIEIIVYCQAQNKYDKEPLAGVSVRVFLKETYVTSGKTNKTGWIDFRLDRGNYTFMAFWKMELVGSLENQSVTGNVTEYVLQRMFNVECELAHITITISDEADHPLPFINVTLTSNKTGTLTVKTNYTGVIATNTFTNTSYTIETRRYGHLFNTTLIENLTVTRWINITCPTYTLFVHVLDSKELPLQNVQVTVYEWSSWVLVGCGTTDNQGNVDLSATFGRYKVKVYGAVLDREVVLNETVVDLIEDGFFVVIHCGIFNVDLYVEALDYFGQPIPKALVEVERKFGLEWVKIDSLPTGLDGFARFVPLRGLVGGDCRVSIYVAGKLCGIRNLYLDGSKQILFNIGKYTMIVGHPVETSQLIVYISIGLLVVVFGLALTYRRLLRRFVKKKEES